MPPAAPIAPPRPPRSDRPSRRPASSLPGALASSLPAALAYSLLLLATPTLHAAPVPKASPSRADAPVPKASPPRADTPVPKTRLDLTDPLTIDRAVALALAHSPGLRAAAHRVRGQELLADAERKPAGPTLGLDIWQVPLARPWAIYDSPMVMLTVRQPIPPVGLLRRRAAARRHDAEAGAAERDIQSQALALAVRHAFIDYEATTARHALHVEHRDLSQRVQDLAHARQSVSGTLLDIARAETETARAHAEVATDATTIDAARIRLNTLLARSPDAPLGPPVALPAETVHADAHTLVTRASDARPEQRAAQARRDAAAMDSQAARRAANVPAADLGLAYFPATRVMPTHGYGLLVNISLPWLSAQGRKRRDAAAEFAAAATDELAESRLQISRQVAESLAQAQSAARRWQALRGSALPASQRARQVALSGYEVGRADLLAMLSSEGAYLEISLEIIDAKATLDHALAELERATGAPLPRVPLLPSDPHAHAARP